jgi:uncharacterized protein (DUF427 family)
MPRIQRVLPGPGQESVWDYPRPPRVVACGKSIRVEFDGQVIAQSSQTLRVLETSHPPVFYIPPSDVCQTFLIRSSRGTFCEFKGHAAYFDLISRERRSNSAAWCYDNPSAAFAMLKGFIAFYPSRVDGCWVETEKVRAQAGDFYGGWITSEICGPFKGEIGTSGW